VASFCLLTYNLDKDQISICSGEAHKMRKQTWDSGYLFVNTRIERMQVGTLVLEPSAWILSRSHIFRVMAETLGEAVSSSPTDISICRCCTHTHTTRVSQILQALQRGFDCSSAEFRNWGLPSDPWISKQQGGREKEITSYIP
jgi:hypothetical protein